MQKKEIEKIRPILWDYRIDPIEFYHIAKGERKAIGFLNQERALIRILDYMDWYDILTLFGIDFLRKNLTPDLVGKLRFAKQREKYEIIRKILLGEPLSFPEWCDETRQRAGNTVLSDRWYRTEPSLF